MIAVIRRNTTLPWLIAFLLIWSSVFAVRPHGVGPCAVDLAVGALGLAALITLAWPWPWVSVCRVAATCWGWR